MLQDTYTHLGTVLMRDEAVIHRLNGRRPRDDRPRPVRCEWIHGWSG